MSLRERGTVETPWFFKKKVNASTCCTTAEHVSVRTNVTLSFGSAAW